ncbi:hypothetical protein Tco_0766952 [Tanacetum coccineum]
MFPRTVFVKLPSKLGDMFVFSVFNGLVLRELCTLAMNEGPGHVGPKFCSMKITEDVGKLDDCEVEWLSFRLLRLRAVNNMVKNICISGEAV